MTGTTRGTIAVTGATGRQGRAVTRELLKAGWSVRALTRNTAGPRARALAALGAEVVRADMNDVASLRSAFTGVDGVYSVQNPFIGGPEAEVRQGGNVAGAAGEMGVRQLVYGSAGTGSAGTGIPSWETKLRIEQQMRELGLPLTILRPMAFMELMTDRTFYPALTTWRLMPALMGPSRPLPWICTDDLGVIAARVFADPDRFIGQDLTLASDVQSLDQCRMFYREVAGRNPRRFPLPPWLFARFGFVGRDLTTMWRWLRTATISLDTTTARELHPDALTVRAWLRQQQVAGSAAR